MPEARLRVSESDFPRLPAGRLPEQSADAPGLAGATEEPTCASAPSGGVTPYRLRVAPSMGPRSFRPTRLRPGHDLLRCRDVPMVSGAHHEFHHVRARSTCRHAGAVTGLLRRLSAETTGAPSSEMITSPGRSPAAASCRRGPLSVPHPVWGWWNLRSIRAVDADGATRDPTGLEQFVHDASGHVRGMASQCRRERPGPKVEDRS